jgi:serine/threonine protein kinase
MQTITVKSILDPNKTYQYIDNGEPIRGGVKDVYFSPDRKYVVAFYRKKLDFNQKERVKTITTRYLNDFFKRPGGDFWFNLYCWPNDMVEHNGLTGIIVPCYDSKFFFKKGYANLDILKGKDKNGKWFASPKFRCLNSKTKIDDTELGNWLSYFQVCVNIARGVKRLHSAGLAHSDLSYNNVLIDPITGSANIIDIDGLVVPGLFNPEVIGTADFIAPEVMATKHLPLTDQNRKLPSRATDLHALAVLIYMYLLYRHPLRGGRYFGQIDEVEEENFMMGSKALFVEHPTDNSNRNFKREYGDNLEKFKPWTDLSKTPYIITGPYLKELFERAFIKGLHNPLERPVASDWEQALIKTTDLKLQCSNSKCEQKWFIYNNTKETRCPFCDTKYNYSIPVIDLYFQFKNAWKLEHQRIVIHHNLTLQKWHINRNIIRNENLTALDKESVGYFSFHNNKWVFVNQKLNNLKDVTEGKIIPIGGIVDITDGKDLIFSAHEGR